VKQQITFYVLGTLLIDSYKDGSVVTSVVDKLVDIYFRFLRNFIYQKLLSVDSWILTGIGLGGRFLGGQKRQDLNWHSRNVFRGLSATSCLIMNLF